MMYDFSPLGIGLVHSPAVFSALVMGVLLTAIGVVSARKASRGDSGPWPYVYYGLLIYCGILFFGAFVDGMFVHPLGFLTPMAVAGLVSGLIVWSQGRQLRNERREEEERRMFAEDL